MLVVMDEKHDPVITGPLAIVTSPRLALESLHISAERIFFELADAARNLPACPEGCR
jgi:hypothetical protein